jgi:hypothetical protein
MDLLKKIRKKKKPNKKRARKINNKHLILSLLMLIIVFLALLLVYKLFIHKDIYYTFESRVEALENAKESDNDNYKSFAWVNIQGTNIDSPIIYSTDGEFDYPANLDRYGWTLGNENKFHNVLNIMGHNIFNLSSSPKKTSEDFDRFEELVGFVYYDVASESKYIQLTIDDKEYIYKIFAVDVLYAADVNRFPSGEYSSEEVKSQLDLFDENNLYDYDVDVDENDSIISVMTCSRIYGARVYSDILVSGRLLRDGEKITDYKVSTNDNYEKLQNIMKGADSDEEDSV